MKPPAQITSLSNPLIKQARALRQRKYRMDTGTFLVEGLHHIGEALEAGWEVDWLLYAADLLGSGFGMELIRRSMGGPIKLQPVSAKVMESLAGKDNPQGLLAIVRQKRFSLQDLTTTLPVVVLVSPQDPGNVGTILRTIDAVGAGGLMLVDSSLDPFHPSLIRASMGSCFWVPVVQCTFRAFPAWAHDQGREIIGTSAHAPRDYRDFTASGSWALVMGNEQKGLPEGFLQACDVQLSLPMHGRVSSLNLAVATGILLYHLCNLKGPPAKGGPL